MAKRYTGERLGILGGGQLGRMLLPPAHRLGVKTWVLDPDPEAPAKGLAQNFMHGSFKDAAAVLALGQQVDRLTIEIEHVAVEPLRELVSQGKKVYPQPEVIALVQDKGLQKQFYEKQGFPTAPFRLVEGKEAIKPEDLPLVQKSRTAGYDGKGVQVLRSAEDLANAFTQPSVLEQLVDIEKEIAVQVARNPQGQCVAFPPVEMAFHPTANLVEFLFSPAALSTEQVRTVQKLAVELTEALDVVGLLSVEFFLDKQGQWLINEIAPRPHNSGHHTIEANVTSQFEQHLRAVMGLPLGSPALLVPAVMVNLLGAEGHDGPVAYAGVEQALQQPGVALHLYGKAQTRPFRKMGHATVVDHDLERAKEKARWVQQHLRVEALTD